MVEIGKYNTLKIVKDLDFGVYLDGGNGVEILLPNRYVPKNVKPGDEVEVFIYHDNEGRLIANYRTSSGNGRGVPVHGGKRRE